MLSGIESRLSEKFERGQVLQLRVAFEGGVQLVDVALMMLGVMDLHGARVDVRLERIERIRQFRQLERHIDSCVCCEFSETGTPVYKNRLCMGEGQPATDRRPRQTGFSNATLDSA